MASRVVTSARETRMKDGNPQPLVLRQDQGPVARLVLNSPGNFNALSLAMIDALEAAGKLAERLTKAFQPYPVFRLKGVSGTGVSASPLSNQAARLSTTRSAIASRVATEAEATCGRSETFGSASSASGTLGSS